MFFEKQYKYTIIDNEITTEELQKYLKEQDIGLQIVDNSTEWAAFAQYYGRRNGLNDIVATSFSYMISLFMTGMGISASTEMYFREEQIEFTIIDALNNMNKDIAEEKKAVMLFEFIFNLYHLDIRKYEYKTEKLDFRLGISDYDKFMNIPGKSKSDKLRELLLYYYSQ